MNHLRHEEVLKLHAAALAARLAESRSALLAGIDPGFVARLPREASPSDQLLRDLDMLNAMGEGLADGRGPLVTWLANAHALAAAYGAAAVFEAALEHLRDQGASKPATGGEVPRSQRFENANAPPRQDVEVRLFNLVAAEEWTIAVKRTTTLLQLVRELRTIIHDRPWRATDVPAPGPGYRFRCYRSEADAEPLSPHLTVGDLVPCFDGRLSLNVEWYTSFRGDNRARFR